MTKPPSPPRRYAEVINLELMPQPPKNRAPSNPWPHWPLVFKAFFAERPSAVGFVRGGKAPIVKASVGSEGLGFLMLK